MTPAYLPLGLAILAEVIGTTALKSTDGFTRPLPSMVVVASYAISFYFLALALKTMSTGVAYATWSGAGIVLIALLGWLLHGQRLDAAAMAGMAMIVGGVAVIHLFSESVKHV